MDMGRTFARSAQVVRPSRVVPGNGLVHLLLDLVTVFLQRVQRVLNGLQIATGNA